MTKLISGRVHKVPSANVSVERYQFLEISEAEPDLGLPSQLGQVFTSDLSGNRYWVRLDTANVIETTNQYFTNVRVLQAVDPKLTTANVTELTNQYFSNVRVLQVVDPKLTTANVLELTNQYFSNVRVLQVVDPKLTTANVTELNNLYFTAQRVIAALEGNNVVVNNLTVSGDLEVQGNLVSINAATLNVEDKNILIANGAINPGQANGAGITIAGANAEITYQNTGDQFNINKNVNVQGNVTIDGKFIGNGLVIRNIVVSDEILTGNILGQGFTSNTIVVSETLTANVIRANAITATAWNGIFTANVTESPNSLYYTNSRVFSFVSGMSIGDLVDVANIYTHQVSNALIGIQQGQALVWNGNIFIPTFVNSEVANVADLSVKVLSLENQTTANVREAASNLYFTNTRVLDAISLATINPDNINANNIVTNVITANIWNRLYTANVIETSGNLYFTTARTVDTVTPLLTTANVIEATSNLYFTTARARNSVSNSTGVYYSSNTGVFSIGQDVAITSDVQFKDLTVSGNLFILGNVAIIAANTVRINDPLLQLGVDNPGDQWDLGFVGHYLDGGERHAGLFRDATDGKFKFFSNTLLEPGNVNYIDTAEDSFRLASIVAQTLEGNVIGTVSSLSNHTTDALAEGQTNRYYTNARTVQTVTPLLTTSNVVEGTNLYFTNARVLANVEQMSINVLADVDITGVSVNSALVWDGTKFIPGSTEASLRANFANTAGSANVALLADRANLVSSLSNHDTANLAEGTNLYYTNSRVLSALVYANVLVADLRAAGNLVANGLIIRGINVNDTVLTGNINITNIAAANVISANIISAQQWQGLYTANVIESPTNLYFTNTRARAAFTPGKGIAITAGGIIKNIGAPFEYNTGIDGSGYGNVLSTMSALVTFPSAVADDRFLLRSIHITNVSDTDTLVSGNVLYATGNTAILANQLPVSAGGVVELLRYPQLFQPSDKVNLQGFTSGGVATSNLLQAIYTYETFTGDITYKGEGKTLAVSNTDIMLFSSPEAFAIIESIKFVNLVGSVVPVKLFWADANNNIKAYLAHNLPVPPNSTIETITAPKRISSGDKIFARYTNAAENSISVFLSARTGFEYSLVDYAPNVAQSGTVSVAFSSSESDGTLLYYTIE